jgi:hypothetical protein
LIAGFLRTLTGFVIFPFSLGGAVVCTLYKKMTPGVTPPVWQKSLGYNPATEARGIVPADVEKVASKKTGHIAIKEELFHPGQVMQAKI